MSWLQKSNCRFKINSHEKSLNKILNVWRNRGSRGSFSSAVHARFMLMHHRPSYLMVLASLFDILSQVRERLSLMWENHSLDKFSPALLSFPIVVLKDFLYAVLQQSLGFNCNLLFSLCFLLKNNVHNEGPLEGPFKSSKQTTSAYSWSKCVPRNSYC